MFGHKRNFIIFIAIKKDPYPSATVKLLWVAALLNPGDGELFTYVASGHGEHWGRGKKHRATRTQL